MRPSRLFVVVLLLLGAAVSVDGQQQTHLVWGLGPACGAKDLSPESAPFECSRTVNGNIETFHLKHGKTNISMRYWWYTGHIRVWAEVENGSDDSLPIDVSTWFVTGYRSFAAFSGKENALFLSKAQGPRDSIGLTRKGGVGVPSSPGGATLPDGGGNPERSIAPIPTVVENRPPSALKWKEIRPRSKQSGEMHFDTTSGAKYLRVTFNVNETNYIYPLEKP